VESVFDSLQSNWTRGFKNIKVNIDDYGPTIPTTITKDIDEQMPHTHT